MRTQACILGLVLLLTAGAAIGGDININFQPSGSTVPSGYLADVSEPFGDRGNGYSYGWDASFDETRERNSDPDQRYDTLNHVQKSGAHRIWEISLANGDYEVWLVCGDPSYTDQINDFLVEGTLCDDPDGEDNFDEYTVTVTVSDGRLTIEPGSGASNAKICFVEITEVGGSTAPAAPTNLTATAVSESQIDLDWDDNSEPDLDSYNVYSDTTSGFTCDSGTLLVSGVTASNYSDTGLSAGTTYYYKVTAMNTSYEESSPSNEASATTDSGGGGGDTIDFNTYTIQSYDSSQDAGSYEVLDGGATLRIYNNAWKKIDYAYTVTADTVLEFDFKGGTEVEIQGIGFDNDDSISAGTTFQVYGTQNWGNRTYTYTGGGSYQHFTIPVGESFTGSMLYLTFVCDDDAGGGGEAYFSNVEVYESGGGDTTPPAAPTGLTATAA
ncbi:MAG: fibronectin type III domain-containing protein, partial [Phycisphaerae bacterium]